MKKRETAYSVFIEDKAYLLWQLELFLYSLTRRAGIAQEDIVVFWASPDYFESKNQLPQPSPWLKGIMSSYPNSHFKYCQNFGRQPRVFRFFGDGNWESKPYLPLNKWTSLVEWANSDFLNKWKEVWILEQDLWFYNEFPEAPKGNVVSYNWIPDWKNAFKKNHNPGDTDKWQVIRGFRTNKFKGQDLEAILDLVGTTKRNKEKWKQGAVLYKFKTRDLKPKLLNDILNFNYMFIHLMEIKHPLGLRYETEMVATGLALAHNGVDLQQVDDKRFLTETWVKEEEIEKGTIVHYGWDFKNYNHLNSSFKKHAYPETAPWQGGLSFLKEQELQAKPKWLKLFFQDMRRIHEEYPKVLRMNNKKEVQNLL